MDELAVRFATLRNTVRLYKEPTRPYANTRRAGKITVSSGPTNDYGLYPASRGGGTEPTSTDSGPPVVRRSRASIGGTGGQGLVRQGPERPRCGAALTDMLMPRRGCGALWEGLRSGRGP